MVVDDWVGGGGGGGGAEDLDQGCGGGGGFVFHGRVGGGWGYVHGVAAGDGRGVGVLPCVMAGEAVQDEDSDEQNDGREEGCFGAVGSAG